MLILLIVKSLSIALFYYTTKRQWLEKNLQKILYNDAKGYSARKNNPKNYFTLSANANVKNNDNKDGNTSNTGGNGDTTRELKNEEVVVTDNNNKNVLKLKDNELEKSKATPIPIQDVNFNMNNYIVNSKLGEGNPKNDLGLFSKHTGLITKKDLEELEDENLFYDNRTFTTMLKDLLISNHDIIALIFKRSLIDPGYLRLLKFIFECSLQYAINAMLFTDGYIDIRQTKKNQVLIFLI
jgi:hypothetical protein